MGWLVRYLQQPIPVGFDDPKAFAGCFFQTFRVINFYLPTVIADDAGLLKSMGDDRYGVALHAYHSRQQFLGQRQGFAVAQLARTQQPARQARLDRVRRIAGGRLLGFRQQGLLVPRKQGAKGNTPIGRRAKACDVEHEGGARLENNGLAQ